MLLLGPHIGLLLPMAAALWLLHTVALSSVVSKQVHLETCVRKSPPIPLIWHYEGTAICSGVRGRTLLSALIQYLNARNNECTTRVTLTNSPVFPGHAFPRSVLAVLTVFFLIKY